MDKQKKHTLKMIGHHVFGVLAAILLLMTIFKGYALQYYHEDTQTIAEIESSGGAVEHKMNKDMYLFYPKEMKPTCGIVFYPGGKVEFSAYRGLLYALAEKGYVCVVPRMPENLAFLRIEAASKVPGLIPSIDKWYLAGHSLGGVAAGRYVATHANDYEGIIFCASYTTSDLKNTDLRVLNIYGSEDKVLNLEKFEEAQANLPKDTTTYVIGGGCHSYFGCYGLQKGDGEPTLTNQEQIKEVVKKISGWIDHPEIN